MIAVCPHCGRSVANDETIGRDKFDVWYPTACAAGDGPMIAGPVVRNHLRFYVSIRDGARRGYLMGPYPSYDRAESMVHRAAILANRTSDPHAAFASYGVCSSNLLIPTVFGTGDW